MWSVSADIPDSEKFYNVKLVNVRVPKRNS